MKLTLSVLQRHVRDLHVAVVLAVPCYAAFSATELPSQKYASTNLLVKFVGQLVCGFFRCHTIYLAALRW